VTFRSGSIPLVKFHFCWVSFYFHLQSHFIYVSLLFTWVLFTLVLFLLSMTSVNLFYKYITQASKESKLQLQINSINQMEPLTFSPLHHKIQNNTINGFRRGVGSKWFRRRGLKLTRGDPTLVKCQKGRVPPKYINIHLFIFHIFEGMKDYGDLIVKCGVGTQFTLALWIFLVTLRI